MKTKLFISIVAVISALSVASVVADCKGDVSTLAVPEDMYCEFVPVHEWEECLC